MRHKSGKVNLRSLMGELASNLDREMSFAKIRKAAAKAATPQRRNLVRR